MYTNFLRKPQKTKPAFCYLYTLVPVSFSFFAQSTLMALALLYSFANHVLMFLFRYAIVYLAQMKPLINPILSGE